MKKVYEAPSVEKVEFQYRDQVVVASGYIAGECAEKFENETGAFGSSCFTGEYTGDKTKQM